MKLSAVLRLGRAVRLVWQHAPRLTTLNVGLIVIQGTLPVAALYALKRVLDAVSAASASPDAPALMSDLWLWLFIAGGIGLLTAGARLAGEYLTEAQSLAVTDGVTDALHTRSVALDLAYYEDPAFYDTLHRAQAQAPFRPSRVVTGLVQVGQNGLALAGIVVWLMTLNWALGLVLFLAVLPGAALRLIASRRLYELEQRQTEQQRKAWYYHALLTGVEHAKELRLFGLGALFQGRHRDLRTSLRASALRLSRDRTIADLAGQAVTVVALFGAVAWVAMQAVAGGVALGDVAVYYVGFQTGVSLLQAVLRALAGLYEDQLFLTNLYGFLDLEPKITRPSAPVPVPRSMTRGIECHDVSFRYPSHSSDTLSGISLTIAPGEVVALVGENGAGKSTLVKLLCRLYDPVRGSITVDGVDLRSLDPVEWRRHLTVTFQDFVQYALSAGENIRVGDVEVPHDVGRLHHAAAQAGADSVVARLPQQYDTPLGHWFSGGQELSGGEWQRLATARAFWREAPVVILDEPSSALDPLAEAALLEQFRALLAGKTAVVISHRFSTVQMADRVYVMDQGRIIEHGTHAELLAHDGHYARLYRTQAQHYRER